MTTPHPVALITGASRGIGAATARELARRGHHVIVNYRASADAAHATVAAIESSGGTATAIAADVCDQSQVDALVDEVAANHGRIDVLVGNANTRNPNFTGLESLPWEDFIGKVTAELAGAFLVTRRVLPVMRSQGRGQITYISSTAADYLGNGRLSHSTAKSALNTFTRHVAAEAAPYGITVNAIAPGAVRTPAAAAVLTPDREAHLRAASLLGRMLEPPDIAAVVGLLTEEAMRAVTGAVLRVDAGYGVLVGAPSSHA